MSRGSVKEKKQTTLRWQTAVHSVGPRQHGMKVMPTACPTSLDGSQSVFLLQCCSQVVSAMGIGFVFFNLKAYSTAVQHLALLIFTRQSC